MLQGRNFSDADTDTSLPVALINRTLAQTYFPGEDPIGKQIRLGLPQPMVSSTAPSLRFTIIGVIGDAINRGLTLPPAPQLTTLFRQTPDLNYGFKNLIVRTILDPLQLAPPIGQQLHLLDADLPFAEVSTMNEIMQQQTSDRRYTTGLLILFAAFGLGLAAVGVYGVVSYIVARWRTELGILMALGSDRLGILMLMFGETAKLLVAGLVVGAGLSLAAGSTAKKLLFGLEPHDATTMLMAAAVLAAVALAASYLPARRAAAIDPMIALRDE